MSFFEKYFPETRRFKIFAWIYFLLFMVLFGYLFTRQVLEREDYLQKERKQGQRRIIKPGARGDVVDRHNNLLIGNQPHYSATLHLELIAREIWEKKILLRRISRQTREALSLRQNLSIADLIQHCIEIPHVKSRGVVFSGKKTSKHNRITVQLKDKRLNVEENSNSWHAEVKDTSSLDFNNLQVLGSNDSINVNIAGLFSLPFQLDTRGFPIVKKKPDQNLDSSFLGWLDFSKKGFLDFSVSGFNHSWEARLAVVQKYLQQVNKLTGRNQSISLSKVKKHWHNKLVLPLDLSGNLTNEEYAILIEKLSPDSPIQIQARPVRHYPHGFLASHVLGYVGSGYEADSANLSGSDLATFELQGRTGKAGIEKTLDHTLRGEDGVDIWIVNPMGSRFERIQREPSKKGKMVQITLDKDLQFIAEQSIERMVKKVADQRILPDKDWATTLERRTNRALLGTNETDVSAELLLSAFKDAPFPLTGQQSSTVAGFKGTIDDAQRLLQHLYAQGVLEKAPNNPQAFFLAPPPDPPGAAVLIDLETSDILSLANKPNYDLSSLTPYISQAAYDEIQRREAWLPRAWHPGYAPASPFKLVTALAGLRSGNIDPDETIECEGIYRSMKCHVYPGQHGALNLHNAISQSCNVYFFRSAEKIGHHVLINEAKKVGMDKKPDLCLPTLRDIPILPDPKWKKEHIGINWTMEDTFNISIGQGGLRQSPLQMASFVAKLATNQKDFEPKLILDQKQNRFSDELLISSDQRQEIIDGMILATREGTARRCQIQGIEIAGKTGTGQWRNHNMKLNLAWFVGFAPAESPKVAIAVLVEGVIPQDQVQGGLTATPIAKDILSAYFSKYSEDFSATSMPTP